MKYLEFIAEGACIASGIFMCLTAIGAAIKTVQWIGKKLDVPRLDIA